MAFAVSCFINNLKAVLSPLQRVYSLSYPSPLPVLLALLPSHWRPSCFLHTRALQSDRLTWPGCSTRGLLLPFTSPSPSLLALAMTYLFLYRMTYSGHVTLSVAIHCLSFCDWLFSLRIMFLKFIHAVECYQYSFFYGCIYSIEWRYILFIH